MGEDWGYTDEKVKVSTKKVGKERKKRAVEVFLTKRSLTVKGEKRGAKELPNARGGG